MISNAEIKEILLGKNINYLYHVNTVITSLTFLNNGGLLSRGMVDDMGLIQTPQESDEKDKYVGVYYDIFFDSDDIHRRAKKINDYGPITFVYSINLLDELPDGIIEITKDNPIRWRNNMDYEEKYFTNTLELRRHCQKGTFGQHITLRNMHKPIPFSELVEIIIDNPQIDNTKYYNNAFNAINIAMKNYNITVPLKERICPKDCICNQQYNERREGYTYYRFRTK